MKAQLYRWHRRLGMATFLFVALWAFSGILHPIMVWTGPQSAHFLPPPNSTDGSQVKHALPDLLRKQGITTIEAFHLRGWRGRTFYQVRPAGHKDWFFLDAETGEMLADGDRDYAIYLARYYTGELNAPVKSVERIDKFGKEFVAFNQLLPVYKVSFERPDGLRAYVDTETGMLGDLINNWKGSLEWTFQTVHLLDWLSPIHPLLPTAMAVIFAILTFFGAATGLYFALVSKPRAKASPARRWHRKAGLAVSAFLLLASFSGAIQAAFKFRKHATHEEIYAPTIPVKEMETNRIPALSAGDDLRIVSWPGHLFYQILHAPVAGPVEVKYIDAAPGEEPARPDEAYALFLAGHFSGVDSSNVSGISQITHFDNEYGFFRRRLPVWRVAYKGPGSPRYYVDTLNSRMVLQQDNPETARNLIFAFFHKYNWIDAMAGSGTTVRAVRDIVSVVITLGIAFVALSGMTFLWKAKRHDG